MQIYACGYNSFLQLPIRSKSEKVDIRTAILPEKCDVRKFIFSTVEDKVSNSLQDKIAIDWSTFVYCSDSSLICKGFYNRKIDFPNEAFCSSVIFFQEKILVCCNSANILSCDLSSSLHSEESEVSFHSYKVERKIVSIKAVEEKLFGLSDSGIVGLLEENNLVMTFTPICTNVKITKIACGKVHTLLLTSEGRILSFGNGSRGQLGHGCPEDDVTIPCEIEALSPIIITDVSAGGWHSAALSEIGDLYMWGWNESGQLGLSMKVPGKKPGQSTADCPILNQGLKSGEHIQMDVSSSECLIAEESLKNSEHYGKVKNQMTDSLNESPKKITSLRICEDRDSENASDSQINFTESTCEVIFAVIPQIVDLSQATDTNVRKVSCGSRHTAAVTDNGELYTWGWGCYGQLGHGDHWTRDYPMKVKYFEDNHLIVTDVCCGAWNTFVSTNGIEFSQRENQSNR